jgi:hypothetical protein
MRSTLMGIVVFIMEKTYLSGSLISKVKSDLIYRLLTEGSNVERFQGQITLFKWEGNEEQIEEVPVSNFITEFIVHKTQYDLIQMGMLRNKMLEHPSLTSKEYRKLMEYPNSCLRMLLGFIDEIKYGDRNINIR